MKYLLRYMFRPAGWLSCVVLVVSCASCFPSQPLECGHLDSQSAVPAAGIACFRGWFSVGCSYVVTPGGTHRILQLDLPGLELSVLEWDHALLKDGSSIGSHRTAAIGLHTVLVLALIWMPSLVRAFRVHLRKAAPGHVCKQCGYDLRGTPSSRCSECGALNELSVRRLSG